MGDQQHTFSIVEAEFDGSPLIAVVSEQLRDLEGKDAMPWFVGVSTALSNPTPDGLPTGQEADALNKWEDIIEKEISSRCRFFFVGRVTWKGHRELIYYVDEPKEPVRE